MRLWFQIARMREARGNKMGAAIAKRNARSYRSRPKAADSTQWK